MRGIEAGGARRDARRRRESINGSFAGNVIKQKQKNVKKFEGSTVPSDKLLRTGEK